MNIAINTRFLISNKLEGMGIYTQEIFKRVVQLMPEHTFYFFFDRSYDKEFIFAKNVIPIVISPPARHPFLWYIWFEKMLPKAFEKYKIDLFISPDGFANLKTNIPQIITIHDLAFEHYPNHIPFLVKKYYQYFFPKFCTKANLILMVSNFTKNDIIEKYKIDSSKIKVIYNAIDKNEIENIAYEKQNIDYFIFIGAIHPRKNILKLIEAFELFKIQNKTNHQLKIIGRNAWMNNEFKQKIQNSSFKKDIIWIEKIERTQLLQQLKNATALVYPSLFEGFGIPVVEAMQLGVPVIASNSSCLPEIIGDAGILLSPNDVEGFANAMQEICSDSNFKNQLIEKGLLQSKKYNWDKSANELVEIIKTKFIQ